MPLLPLHLELTPLGLSSLLSWRRDRTEAVLYAGTVLIGAVLVVLTSANQPYNQNEWQQIAPYDDPDLGVATSGTRQPPLGPFLGVLVQRLLGEGHLEQRLVPMASGVGCLLLMAHLLRRLDLGYAGVAALSFMATAPVFLRFSGYTRPYALPMFLMLLCTVAGARWLDTGRRRWLVVASGAAFALPLARVPEPTAFLAAAAIVLAIGGVRHLLPRGRAWLLAGGLLAGLVTMGAVSLLSLAEQTEQTNRGEAFLDLDPGRALGRVPTGLRELVGYVAPLYGEWFPWWPLTLLAVGAALALRESRRRLLGTWYWVPLVLAPLAFLVAYHTVNAFPLDVRHYRIRFATFWIPPLVVLVAVVIHAVRRSAGAAGAWLAPLLAVALVVGQLPTTWRVLTENDAVDLAMAGRVVEQRLPEGAVVLYTGGARTGAWRQPFFGEERFLTGKVHVITTRTLARGRGRVPEESPIYLLLLDSECMTSVVCDLPGADWSGEVRGYRQSARFDRFTLYAPEAGQRGPVGAATALRSLVDALGPEWAHEDAAAAAHLMVAAGRSDAAAELLAGVCAAHDHGEVDECRRKFGDYRLAGLLR